MALMCEPRLLIADEPTTALDVTIQAQVLRLLKELQRELGLGMILISHDIGVVAAMADRIACMYAGQIVETGPTSEVLAHPRHPYTRGLMRCLPGTSARQARLETIAGSVPPPEERVRGCRFANRCALVIEACESAPVEPIPLSPDRTVRCLRADYVEPMKQRTLPNEGHAATERNGDPILQANAVSHTFKVRRSVFAQAARLQALQGVSLELHRNETVAIVGESGCGKSTLARIALGLLTPTSGSVRIAGGALDALPRREIARLVQPVFQDPYASLAPHRSVVHAVMVPLQVLRIGATAERRWRALQMLEKVGLPGHMADRLPSELSGGQQQRVAIARALVLRPPVLICDEPTSALDVSVQAQILNLLRDLKQEFALSMLLITHNIGVVRQIADRVVVMYLGRIVEEGPVDTVLDHSKHPYTRLLVSSVLEPQRSNDVTPELGEDTQFPDPFNPPSGCAFHPRCVHRSAICTQVAPAERALEPGFVACHHPLPNITSHTREQEWNLTN
jgi:peptide/nickel transport system ATP-binding protein